MFVDHRIYTLPHGRIDEYLERYESSALALQRRHLGHYLGTYVHEMGALDQVLHLWGYSSLADREARRERMARDPAWHAFLEMNAGTFTAQRTRILRAVSFSPAASVISDGGTT